MHSLPTCLPAHNRTVYKKDFQGQKGWFLQTCANHVLKYKTAFTANMKWADDDDVGGHVKFFSDNNSNLLLDSINSPKKLGYLTFEDTPFTRKKKYKKAISQYSSSSLMLYF